MSLTTVEPRVIPGLTLTVPEGSPAFNDHHYETASAYDRLLPIPGTYQFRHAHIRGMVTCEVPAWLLEHYYVNRLFMASSVTHEKYEGVRTVYYFSTYIFMLERGGFYRDGWRLEMAPGFDIEALKKASWT